MGNTAAYSRDSDADCQAGIPGLGGMIVICGREAADAVAVANPQALPPRSHGAAERSSEVPVPA